jgi:ATP-dependent Clp protease adaptor protein ClpS
MAMVLELCPAEMTRNRIAAQANLPGEFTESGTDTQVLRSSKVVLFNDEDHTYDYVVEMLTHCCELSRDAAFYCALEVDMTGRTVVYYGDFGNCKTVCDKILAYGPDHRLPRSMGSMEAEVQGH